MAPIRSRTPREILNEIRFRRMVSGTAGEGGLGLDEAVVTILHRVGPESRPTYRRIPGSDILRLERGFLYTRGESGETAIPYHRVRSIAWGGREAWRRPAR